MDNVILLALITGPGPGFTLIVIAFFAMIVALAMIYYLNKDYYNQGKQEARREGLENLQASIARLVHDQQEIKSRLGYGDAIMSGE